MQPGYSCVPAASVLVVATIVVAADTVVHIVVAGRTALVAVAVDIAL